MIAGLVIGAACLVWLLHDIDIRDLRQNTIDLNWWLIGLAIVVDTATYAIQGLRWKLLLRPLGQVTWLGAAQAVYAGLFASELLPLRPGELVRAYVMSRKLRTPLSSIIPSMVVERLCDGLWIALGLSVAGMLAPLPSTIARTGRYFGIAMLVATVAFVYVAVYRRVRRTGGDATCVTRSGSAAPSLTRPTVSDRDASPRRPFTSPLEKIRGSLQDITDGLRTIGFSSGTWWTLALSFTFLTGQAAGLWLILSACHVPLPFLAAATVFLITHLGTAVPNAPANVGTYQLFIVLGLTIFGVDKPIAVVASMVAFLALTIPLWVLGYLAVVRSNAECRI